jgi:trimethylamine--corrinoid protein Co-methyltransferase
MLQSSFLENRSVYFRVLSGDQVWEIQQAAFDMLEKTGCRVMHEGALRLLKQTGFDPTSANGSALLSEW